MPINGGGGLGIGSARIESAAAYYGSLGLVAPTMAGFPNAKSAVEESYPPTPTDPDEIVLVDRENLPFASQECYTSLDHINAHRNPTKPLPAPTASTPLKHLQNKASRTLYSRCKKDLLKSDSVSPDDVTRIQHCSLPGSGRFIDAIPKGNFNAVHFSLSDKAYLATIQERLGLNILFSADGAKCRLCGTCMTHHTAHSHVCKKIDKGEYSGRKTGMGIGPGRRHKGALRVFCQCASSLGLSYNSDENGNPAVTTLDGRRVDMIIYGIGVGAKPLAIDFNLPYPLQKHRAKGTIDYNEKKKINKYTDDCDELGFEFTPCVISTFGGLGPAAERLFQRLANIAKKKFGPQEWKHSFTANSFTSHWLQRLDVAIQSENYLMHAAVSPPVPAFEPFDFAS